MDFSKLWPSISMVLITAVGAYADTVQAYIQTHPLLAMIFATLATVIGNLAKSPTQDVGK